MKVCIVEIPSFDIAVLNKLLNQYVATGLGEQYTADIERRTYILVELS